ncbi:MAG: CPBP family intramembrane metalloprotease [Euryarchaeota archaeon]|nr:CPBP family intramembrane metalloprotease [Euryarchaeota archaeon]
MDSKIYNDISRNCLIFILILTVIVMSSYYFPEVSFISYLLIVVLFLIFKKREGGSIPRWGGKGSHRSGLIFGFVLISMIFSLEIGLGWIRFDRVVPGAVNILITGALFQFLVSIAEELSFRGYILPCMEKSIGRWNAIFMTSVLFAALHIPSILFLGLPLFNAIVMFLTVTMAGVLLALLYFTNGLKTSIGFHFSWNFFQYHVFSLRSGLGIFGVTAIRPEFTGGQAGPEAGLLGLVAISTGIILLLLFPGLRKA